ncbi:50S ribosomal protein L10 [Helicobacter saguini]|uniref:Large ribosomal subunit protein uL10 n=1 Tax=Helicobacter saguini TaxID=1548018 RepID=A0A347VSG0_9HELI|nr:50S ribosomal protein L10 [Helicobacter saguini]MWV62523.1 50S ribosomal protein L10 [Helicobacter saguini]MWV66803.1 50S ribosomal protein L10 [Helicobacter saguini]MWV69154.1 50S ribosomal protein L10 [Helicobacter saguini]MWV71291.1 50S ribosomal protein L10 [Helicobacter saguini]TLD94196.1 50S ribosomal protein L10 [Helicobacter saguini]
MTKQDKISLVNNLSESFKNAGAMIICDYKGLNVKSLESLRRDSKKSGIKVQVIKNKLANIALKNAGYKASELKDTNVYIWADEQISLSKVVCKFAEANAEHFKVKFGYFDGEIVDSKHIIAISKLPSKEELIGMLLSVWSAPARYFVTGMDNLRKQKEGA